jgi:hypothetical protein
LATAGSNDSTRVAGAPGTGTAAPQFGTGPGRDLTRAALARVGRDRPFHVAVGSFTHFDLFGGASGSGLAVKADYSLPLVPVTATLWYLRGKVNGDRSERFAATAELRQRFGPRGLAYLALGAGLARSTGSGDRLADGFMFTTGLGVEFSRVSLELRTLHSEFIAMAGYRF